MHHAASSNLTNDIASPCHDRATVTNPKPKDNNPIPPAHDEGTCGVKSVEDCEATMHVSNRTLSRSRSSSLSSSSPLLSLNTNTLRVAPSSSSSYPSLLLKAPSALFQEDIDMIQTFGRDLYRPIIMQNLKEWPYCPLKRRRAAMSATTNKDNIGTSFNGTSLRTLFQKTLDQIENDILVDGCHNDMLMEENSKQRCRGTMLDEFNIRYQLSGSSSDTSLEIENGNCNNDRRSNIGFSPRAAHDIVFGDKHRWVVIDEEYCADQTAEWSGSGQYTKKAEHVRQCMHAE